MNERILELSSQAWHYAGSNSRDGDGTHGGLYRDKFAQLIIRECAELATKEYDNSGAIHGNDLLEHFGVEE
jgi:hypothetical protein